MKIYIELLVILTLVIIWLLWKIWFKVSKWRLLKKYKPENDKAREGGTFNERVEGTKSAIGNATADIIRPEQSQGRELLQKADADSVRKNCKGIRKLLRRRK